MLQTNSKMRERCECLSCGSSDLNELSSGTFEDIRSFIDADPWGKNPMEYIANERWCFVRCDHCGMKFHRFILSPEWNEVRFSQWMNEGAIEQFEQEHCKQNHATAHVQHILRMEKLVGPSPRLLDFGCGSGDFLNMARAFGFNSAGVDRSVARRKIAGFEIANDLSEIDGDFDVITMFEVLEHLDDPLDVLEQLTMRLRPNGVFAIEVPDCSGVTNIVSDYDYRNIHPLDHINAFEPRTLVEMLKRVGLRPIRKQPAYVTTEPIRVAKDIAKAVAKQSTTQRYFRFW